MVRSAGYCRTIHSFGCSLVLEARQLGTFQDRYRLLSYLMIGLKSHPGQTDTKVESVGHR